MFEKEIFINDAAWQQEWEQRFNKIHTWCARCVFNNKTPGIIFDKLGICNYCHQHEELLKTYPGGEKGKNDFEAIVKKIKYAGRNKKYDVIVGVSGGCDSSFMVYLAKYYGLRALAVHFDNTYNSHIAVENIRNVLKATQVELWTYVVNNEEYDAILNAFLKAGIMEMDMSTDLGLAATLNMAARKYGIQYIFEGHSFRTEGVAPFGWGYMDAKYIQSVCKQYSGIKKIKSLPMMWLSSQLKWMLINRLKKIRPLWYLDYDKEAAKEFLTKHYNWKWYGGHHLENRTSTFGNSYFHPRRFDNDQRANGFSAQIRSGQLIREEAMQLLRIAPQAEYEAINYIKKRLKLDDETFLQLMTQPRKTYKDFKTYKYTFEKLRPFFYVMAKMELIPWSFYMKYTVKQP